jgi:hypothetical protein
MYNHRRIDAGLGECEGEHAVRFPNFDAYQWLHVSEPGTYTIHRGPGLKATFYCSLSRYPE